MRVYIGYFVVEVTFEGSGGRTIGTYMHVRVEQRIKESYVAVVEKVRHYERALMKLQHKVYDSPFRGRLPGQGLRQQPLITAWEIVVKHPHDRCILVVHVGNIILSDASDPPYITRKGTSGS